MTEKKLALNTILDQFRAFNEEFRKNAQEAFKIVTKEFFDANPKINSIIWIQYTPYFNDGAECTFAVNEPSFSNALGADIDDICAGDSYEGYKEDIFAISYWCEEEAKDLGLNINAIKDFTDVIMTSEMEDVMRMMFGSHVKVIATRDGFDVEEYDHD